MGHFLPPGFNKGYLFSQDVAQKRVDAFENRFGELHLIFACHAVFPVAFSFELIHDIWVNFYSDIHKKKLGIPEIVIADFLLSDLCHQSDNELYEVDIEIRNILLERLRNDHRFGCIRIRELAEFLSNYIYKELADEHNELYSLAEAQWLTSLAYNRPHKAAYEIVLKYMKISKNDKAELLRMYSLLEMLKEPLFDEFQALFVYSEAMRLFAFGQIDQAAKMIKAITGSNKQVRIAGVTLILAKEIEDKIETLNSGGRENYSHADLQGKSFSRKDLTGADFSYTNLRGADFTGAILKNANFRYSKLGLKTSWIIVFIIFSSCALMAVSFLLSIIGFSLENSIFKTDFLFTLGSLLITLFFIPRRGIEPNMGTLFLTFFGIQSLYIGFIGILVLGLIGGSILGISSMLSGFWFISCGVSLIQVGSWRWAGSWSTFGIVILSLFFSGASIYTLFLTFTDSNQASSLILLTLLSLSISVEIVVSIVVLTISINLIASISKAWSYAVGVVWPVSVTFTVTSSLRVSDFGFLGEVIQITPALASIIFAVWVAKLASFGDERFAFIQQATSFLSSFAGTNFKDADLTEADFTQAILEGGNFRSSNLTRTCWSQVKQLHQAFFTEPYLSCSAVRELLVTGSSIGGNFDFLSLEGINLRNANLENASFFRSDLSRANLQDANLCGAMLKWTKLDKADLSGASLTGTCIENWKLSSTKLDGIDCDFIYMNALPETKQYTNRLPGDNDIFERGEFADFAK
ncbi:MAG: pentapeptide repeat-containing protein [Leptolyngbya sp. SIO1E4]|nr:pentapeptide repeat-containing protein [Leptolyngbya sp. SIO1E4]